MSLFLARTEKPLSPKAQPAASGSTAARERGAPYQGHGHSAPSQGQPAAYNRAAWAITVEDLDTRQRVCHSAHVEAAAAIATAATHGPSAPGVPVG